MRLLCEMRRCQNNTKELRVKESEESVWEGANELEGGKNGVSGRELLIAFFCGWAPR